MVVNLAGIWYLIMCDFQTTILVPVNAKVVNSTIFNTTFGTKLIKIEEKNLCQLWFWTHGAYKVDYKYR